MLVSLCSLCCGYWSPSPPLSPAGLPSQGKPFCSSCRLLPLALFSPESSAKAAQKTRQENTVELCCAKRAVGEWDRERKKSFVQVSLFLSLSLDFVVSSALTSSIRRSYAGCIDYPLLLQCCCCLAKGKGWGSESRGRCSRYVVWRVLLAHVNLPRLTQKRAVWQTTPLVQCLPMSP